jgi:hypothetical protein
MLDFSLSARVDSIEERLDRIEYTMRTLAVWLVQAQTCFGEQDAIGIANPLDGKAPSGDPPKLTHGRPGAAAS